MQIATCSLPSSVRILGKDRGMNHGELTLGEARLGGGGGGGVYGVKKTNVNKFSCL